MAEEVAIIPLYLLQVFMPNKPVGGKGKRESYKTSVVRVPDPIKPQILELIEQFHRIRYEKGVIPVTGYLNPTPIPAKGLPEQLPISLVVELIEIAFPEELKEGAIPTAYDISWKKASKGWDKQWEIFTRPKIERLHKLINRVNRTIWKIDNTFCITHLDTDIHIAVCKLVEFGLLQMDTTALPITGRALADWMISKGQADATGYIFAALRTKRIDVLNAFEVGRQSPIDRHAYWHQKYKSQLAKPGVNYWGWKRNPESREICSELTQLLELPMPPVDVRKVLENLVKTKNSHSITPSRKAFCEWHLATLAQLGRDTLAEIYKVVYGVGWSTIEDILKPLERSWWDVLGVTPAATTKQVKAAMRRLAKKWHPDLNPSPLAKEEMIKVNRAYEEFEKTCNR